MTRPPETDRWRSGRKTYYSFRLAYSWLFPRARRKLILEGMAMRKEMQRSLVCGFLLTFCSCASVAANSCPVVHPVSVVTNQNTSVAFNVLDTASDPDPGDEIMLISVDDPQQGGTLDYDEETGDFLYTPPEGFVGTDVFAYEVSDGLCSVTGTTTITVTAVGPEPEVQAGLEYPGGESLHGRDLRSGCDCGTRANLDWRHSQHRPR
ncbi:MAG: Ig-like domain-containing protein [Planctomycetota bacterium]